MKKPKTAKIPLLAVPPETALILRTCAADMTSYNGFVWPKSGPVKCPDWKPMMQCGHGLHGLLWGEGSAQYLDLSADARWLVFRAALTDLMHGEGELTDKCKAARGTVEYCGDRDGAIAFLYANGAAGKAVVFSTATAGDRGTATAGERGTATAGYRGTATAGYSGTATAGVGGVIAILHWNGKRYEARIARVKDEDGDGELEPNTPYRLNDEGNFVKKETL